MGRLEEIVERNQHPGRHRKGGRFPMGMAVGVFVFVILILVIFTDFEDRPAPPAPAAGSSTAGDKHVDGILLYREKPRAPRDAAAD